MAYRNKTYVCFDADEDMIYYQLMRAWKAKDGKEFQFHNAHDLFLMQNKKLEINDEIYIKRKLRDRLLNTKCFIVLVGKKTKNLYKYVRWEIQVALELDIPIVVVNLNKKNGIDRDLSPPIIKEALAIHIPYVRKAIVKGIDKWPSSHQRLKKEGKTGPYYYEEFAQEN
ncbi:MULTISPECIES: TIR domain-containing protein [Bacillus cereus group]|uniref:TIR domain-containing protein n=1 Tax=Bacillus cereus group TaxID=86661 RepID=UPI0022E4D787|nr:TIR domain-containing protein [Bacillus cereus group sp. BY11-1LC]MDA1890650.1 TIR domain-containing protein [Bacillus cereus group sp. BY11-1LC]HDR4862166.1 TIR domain-containing protein [Bacillus cereus]